MYFEVQRKFNKNAHFSYVNPLCVFLKNREIYIFNDKYLRTQMQLCDVVINGR